MKEAVPELHVSGDLQLEGKRRHDLDIGKTNSLYHLVMGEGQNAFVGNGLGGTSLLNANIFLKMDPKTQKLDDWPAELQDPTSLDKCTQIQPA